MTPKQIGAARALLGWSQADLAKEVGLGITTIADYERPPPKFCWYFGQTEKGQPSWRLRGIRIDFRDAARRGAQASPDLGPLFECL